MHRILAVDDDPGTLAVVKAALEVEGFEVGIVTSGPKALQWIEKHGLPHAAVIDIVMPGMDGLELCATLHKSFDLPIVLLSSVDEHEVIIRALDEVAEDYVIKPFHPRELAVRVRRLVRRIVVLEESMHRLIRVHEDLVLDLVGQKAERNGQVLSLTPIETKILHILVQRSPRPANTQLLLSRIWPDQDVFEDTLRVHIHRLRSKLEPDPAHPCHLTTEKGAGYRLDFGE